MQVSRTPAFLASARFAHSSYTMALIQLFTTLTLYTGVIGLMFASLSIHYAITLLLAILATAAYLRLFMIGHDCGHGSYLPTRRQNNILGGFLGVLTNTPFQYWAKQHLVHHRTTGNLDKRGDGDVITKTVTEYRESSLISRLCYRWYRNPWMLFLVSAPLHFVLLQRVPLGQQWHTREGWFSVIGTNIGICAYYGALIAWFGLTPFLWVYIPVVMFSSAAAVWLFYVQHQFEDAYWQRNDSWTYHDATLQGSSFYNLPKLLHWASGNIGFHHIHHLNPRVPNYHLQTCFADSIVLQQARKLSLRESLTTAWLALWDEDAQRLISFREYSQRGR
ncbi:MAG: fatty acid desaturase [Pseudomonadales bacterium]|nr:fatty acid desaturase [Pseudomonadales bacterium]